MLLNKYEAVLCAGDDETDESMFRLNADGIISIKIGKEDTAAEFRVSGPRAFRDFLTQAIDRLVPIRK